MSLRRSLVLVHVAFAAFAMAAAIATIYAVRLQVRHAASRFERHIGEVEHLDECRKSLQTLDVHLHEVVSGTRSPDKEFERSVRGVLMRLREVSRYSTGRGTTPPQQLDERIDNLEASLNRVITLAGSGSLSAAHSLFKSEIETEQLVPLQGELSQMRKEVETGQQTGSLELLEKDSQLLLIAALVGVAGCALVVTGMLIVRRRLVQPIQALQAAATTFAAGNLDHRVELPLRDELGDLAETMNGMAAALHRSQRKYQHLFENLRDAVVICDQTGMIRECHNGDANLLTNATRKCAGQNVAQLWPNWRFHGLAWEELIARVISHSQPIRYSDVAITASDGGSVPTDIVAYSVVYADEPYVAIVFRDVAERQRLQQAARRAETMEAAVNFARGIAHDFKNLLQSAQVSLDGIREATTEPQTIERATTAMEACRQAASLSRRLARFSAADAGDPEPVELASTTRVLLDALDQALFDGISVKVDCAAAPAAKALIDRDQFTQIMLNLVYNAIDAMPDGGSLDISISREPFAHPLADRSPTPHVLVRVRDTGCGIDSVALEHVFEPMYSTKPRSQAGPRGMGLAVVYAAVTHAAGFVQIDSTPGSGTVVRIHLPELLEAVRPMEQPHTSGQLRVRTGDSMQSKNLSRSDIP